MKSKELENRLAEVHKNLLEFSTQIDINFEKTGQEFIRIDGWTPIGHRVKIVEYQLPTQHSTVMNVVFEPGGYIDRHNHINHEETIFVIEGSVGDADTGAIIKENGVYVIKAGDFHTISSEIGARTVEIFRPKMPVEPKND